MAKEIVKAKKSTALVNWDEELAKAAEATSAAEKAPSGSFMSCRAGVLSVAGQPVKDNKAKVVVLDAIFENAYYAGEYDSDNPQPPVCFALATEEGDLAPHPDCAEPQHEQCKGCPKNEFGSAAKGKGKACKNIRRLAIVPADQPDSELFFFKIPVTSVAGWAYYLKGLNATLKRPYYAMRTEIGTVPDPKSQFKITFSPIEPIPNSELGPVMQRRQEAQEAIKFPYSKPSEQPAAAPSKKRKF